MSASLQCHTLVYLVGIRSTCAASVARIYVIFHSRTLATRLHPITHTWHTAELVQYDTDRVDLHAKGAHAHIRTVCMHTLNHTPACMPACSSPGILPSQALIWALPPNMGILPSQALLPSYPLTGASGVRLAAGAWADGQRASAMGSHHVAFILQQRDDGPFYRLHGM